MAILPNREGVCARPAINITLGYQKSMSTWIGRCRVEAASTMPFLRMRCIMWRFTITICVGILIRSGKARTPNSTQNLFFQIVVRGKAVPRNMGEVYAQHVRDTFFSGVSANRMPWIPRPIFQNAAECLPAGIHDIWIIH